jgi:hypothetical protein
VHAEALAVMVATSADFVLKSWNLPILLYYRVTMATEDKLSTALETGIIFVFFASQCSVRSFWPAESRPEI